MNREQAAQIARKHHLQVFNDKHASIAKWVIDAIMEAVAVEREACARVCEEHTLTKRPDKTRDPYITTLQCAAAIRARGE